MTLNTTQRINLEIAAKRLLKDLVRKEVRVEPCDNEDCRGGAEVTTYRLIPDAHLALAWWCEREIETFVPTQTQTKKGGD